MFSKLIHHESKTIGRGAFVIGFFFIINGLLAVARNALLASKFGAGPELDAYYAAFRLPDFIYAILIAGALTVAFIPLFNEKLNISKEKAWNFTNNALSVFGLALTITATIIAIFAPFLVKILAPGFNEYNKSIVTSLTRVMMIQPILLGISNIVTSVLQNFKRFFITSLAPIFYNLGIIFGIIFLTPIFGLRGLAWGVVLGAGLNFLIQWPALKNLGFSFKFIFDWRSPDLRAILKLMGPRILGLISIQINFLAITIIASKLSSGSLSIFNFSNDLQSLPQNIFAASFAIAAFPILTTLAPHPKEWLQELRKTLQSIIFFILPIATLFLIFRHQIVGLALGYGKFNFTDSIFVAQALGIFALSMLAQGLLAIFVRAFFTLQDSWNPFWAGLGANLANIILGIILANKFGVLGLVSAFAIASWLNLLWLAILLRKKIKAPIFNRNCWLGIGRIISASVLASIAGWVGINIFSWFNFTISPWLVLLGEGITGGLLAILIYLIFLKIIKAPELEFWNSFFDNRRKRVHN